MPDQPELDAMPPPLAMRVDTVTGTFASKFTDEVGTVGDERVLMKLQAELVKVATTTKDGREIHTHSWRLVMPDE